jgi:Sigma-70, region 4
MLKLKNMDYKKICENYLKDLPQRTADVVERRFGLKSGERETLEAIGLSYGITRERVRQIEREGFEKIRPEIRKNQEIFSNFKKTIESFGGLKKESELLDILGQGKYQNQIFFLLTNGEGFDRAAEDDNFYAFWTTDKKSFSEAKKVINSTISEFKKNKKTISLDELANGNKEVFASYIGISKEIQKNPEGKYGLRNWLEINPRGIKDKAYLVLKKKEEPLHFTQIASLIGELPFSANRKVHTATVHNELIKDDRFILVGRGLYALKEWGYETGVVKDIILKSLKQAKRPLTKDEIVSKVLEQRFVKENTVLLNLQNKQYFVRDEKGRYNIKEA